MKPSIWLLIGWIGVAAPLHAAVAPAWEHYKNDALAFEMDVPQGWEQQTKGQAVVIRGNNGAIFGLLRHDEPGTSLYAALAERYPSRPPDWVMVPARIDNIEALKTVGTDPKDPARKIVAYFVKSSKGYTYIQLVAAKSQWSGIQPYFDRMVRTLKFYKDSPEADELLKALQ